MTTISTKDFFLQRHFGKMQSTMAAKKYFRGRTLTVFVEDKGPNPKWDFVDGSPCSRSTGIARDKLFSLVWAIHQTFLNFSPRLLKYKHPSPIRIFWTYAGSNDIYCCAILQGKLQWKIIKSFPFLHCWIEAMCSIDMSYPTFQTVSLTLPSFLPIDKISLHTLPASLHTNLN